MKTIDLTCANCEKMFQKPLNEYKRQTKNGNNRFFCSHRCSALTTNKENPPKGDVSRLTANNRKDQYTPFRWYVLRSQYRDRKKKYGCDITVEYLKQLWEEQGGICPFTKWKLILPQNTSKAWEINDPRNASLDRIDNSKGYIQGNVRFISVMANIARQTFSDEQLIDFCNHVTIHNHNL